MLLTQNHNGGGALVFSRKGLGLQYHQYIAGRVRQNPRADRFRDQFLQPGQIAMADDNQVYLKIARLWHRISPAVSPMAKFRDVWSPILHCSRNLGPKLVARL
jgi:hypothetical protein